MSLARDLALLKRGAAINVLGAMGRMVMAGAPILGTQLFGDRYGAIALCMAVVGMAGFFCSAGFADATQFLCAHDADTKIDEGARNRMAAVVVAAMAVSVSVSAVLCAVLLVAGDAIATHVLGRPSLGFELGVVGIALPFVATTAVATAALRSSMAMGSDVAVKSFVIPIVFVGGAVAARGLTPEPVGMAWAFVGSQIAGATVALVLLSRKFALSRSLRLMRTAPWRPLLKFAVPQSANMALYQATFDLDLVMLGATGTPDRLLGAYRIASEIARQIFTIRVTFSGVYASLVARLAHLGETRALSDSIGVVSGWCVLIAAPVGGVLIIARADLLSIAGYPEVSSTFFSVLVLGSILSCATGLTGNVIGMTGRPVLNLFNAVGATAVNAGCNYLLVPRMGLLGAAIATTLGIGITQLVQIIETHCWFDVRLAFWPVARPLVYCILAFGAAALLQFGVHGMASWQSCLCFVAGYATLYLALERRLYS